MQIPISQAFFTQQNSLIKKKKKNQETEVHSIITHMTAEVDMMVVD